MSLHVPQRYVSYLARGIECPLTTPLALPQASFTEAGTREEFNVSSEVAILGVSLFVQGLGASTLSN